MEQVEKEETSDENNKFSDQPLIEVSDMPETFEIPKDSESATDIVNVDSDINSETAKPTEIQELSEMEEPIEVPELIEDVKPYESPVQEATPEVTEPSSEPVMSSIVEEPKKYDDAAPIQDEKPVKLAKKGHTVQLVVVIFIVWSIITAGGAYLLRDKAANDSEAQTKDQVTSLQNQLKAANQKEADLQSQIDELNGTSTSVTKGIAPSSSAASSIKAAITSGNTAALEGYMASSVVVATATSNSTAVITGTPAKAVSSVTSFITGATSPWDFALASSVLSSYEASSSHGKYFPTIAIVGKSANNKVISFSFDSTGKISTVLLANSDSSL